MASSDRVRQNVKLAVLVLAVSVVVVVALPLLAVAALSLRFVVAGLLLVALVGLAMSRTFRRWVSTDAELASSYLGLRMPGDEHLFPQHTWARIEGASRMRIGADDLVQRLMGPLDAVELSQPGTALRRGDVLARLSRGGRTLALRSPVAGKVAAVNDRLAREPRLINEAPYGSGWAAVVEVDDVRASRRLTRRGADARLWLRAEIDRLMASLAPAAAPLHALQDGGHLVADVHDAFDDATWRDLKGRFFGDDDDDDDDGDGDA